MGWNGGHKLKPEVYMMSEILLQVSRVYVQLLGMFIWFLKSVRITLKNLSTLLTHIYANFNEKFPPSPYEQLQARPIRNQ